MANNSLDDIIRENTPRLRSFVRSKVDNRDDADDMFTKADPDYAKKPDVKWNFTKFLIDQEGNVAERFEPTATKEVLAPAIEALLK